MYEWREIENEWERKSGRQKYRKEDRGDIQRKDTKGGNEG